MQNDPRAVCELGFGPPMSVGQAGMRYWAATIKKKRVRAIKSNLHIAGGVDFGGRRNRAKVPRGWVTSGPKV